MKKGKKNSTKLKVALLVILIVLFVYIGLFILFTNGFFLQNIQNEDLIGQPISPFESRQLVTSIPSEPVADIKTELVLPSLESKKLMYLPNEKRARALAKVDLVKDFFLGESTETEGDLVGGAFSVLKSPLSSAGDLVVYNGIKISPLAATEEPTEYLFYLTDELAREINSKLTPSLNWAINVTLDGAEARFQKQGVLSLQTRNGIENVFFTIGPIPLAEAEHKIKVELYKPRRVLTDLTVEEGFRYNSPEYTVTVRSAESAYGRPISGEQRARTEIGGVEITPSEERDNLTFRGRSGFVSGEIAYAGPIVTGDLRLTGRRLVNLGSSQRYALKLRDPLLNDLRGRYSGRSLASGAEFNANVKFYVNGVLIEEKQFDNTRHLERSEDSVGGVIKIFDFFRDLFKRPLTGEAITRLPSNVSRPPLNISVSESKDITTFDYTFTEEGTYSLYAIYDISYDDLSDSYRSEIFRVTVSEPEVSPEEEIGLPTTCTFSSDCGVGYTCLLGSCIPSCEADADCDEGQVCSRNVCILEEEEELVPRIGLPEGEVPSVECDTTNIVDEGEVFGVYDNTALCEDTYLTKPAVIHNNLIFDCNGYDLRLNGSIRGSIGIIVDNGITATIKDCAFKNFESAILAENVNTLTLLNNSFDVNNAWNIYGNTLRAHNNNVSFGRVLNSVQNLELSENFFREEVNIIGGERVTIDNPFLSAYNVYNGIVYVTENKGIFVNDKFFNMTSIQSIANQQSDVILVDSDYNFGSIGNSGGLVRGFYTAEPELDYNNIPNMLNVRLTAGTEPGETIYELSWEAVKAMGSVADEFVGVVSGLMLFLRDISDGVDKPSPITTQRNQLTLTISTHGNELFRTAFDPKTLRGKLEMRASEPLCLSPGLDKFYVNPLLYSGMDLSGTWLGEFASDLSRSGMFYEIMTNKNIEICEGDYNIIPSERIIGLGSPMITVKGDNKITVECKDANLNYNLGPILFADNNKGIKMYNCNLMGENTSMWINTPVVNFRYSSINIPRIWFTEFSINVDDDNEWNDVIDRSGEVVDLYDTSLTTEMDRMIIGSDNQINQYWSVNAKVVNGTLPIVNQHVTFDGVRVDEAGNYVNVSYRFATDENGRTDALDLLSKGIILSADSLPSVGIFLWRLSTTKDGETYSKVETFSQPTEVLFDLSTLSAEVECTADTDCAEGFECVDNTCQEIVECLPECASGEVCLSGECITPECTEEDDCEEDEICNDNYECEQVECKDDADCTGDEVCNVNYECVECTSDSDCGEGFECRSYQCVEEGAAGGVSDTGGRRDREVCSPVDFTECLNKAEDAECKLYTTGQHKIVQCEVTEACDIEDNLGYVRYSCEPNRYSLSVLDKLPSEIPLRAGEQPRREAPVAPQPAQPPRPQIPREEPPQPVTAPEEISLWWLLLLIIPALAILGYALYQQYGRKGGGVSPMKKQPPEKGEQSKLNNYVNEALRRGQTKDKITGDLLKVGWSQKQIDEAFSHRMIARHAGKQLDDYIKYYKSRGFTSEEIRESLLKAGWQKEVVDKYLH